MLFICNRTPWKTTLLLPRVNSFTVNEVRTALESKGAAVPSFPLGRFDVVESTATLQVALFRHETTSACGAVLSRQHGALPRATRDRKVLNTPQQPPLQVGYKYMYGKGQAYVMEGTEVSLNLSTAGVDPIVPEDDFPREVEKSSWLVHVLSSYLGDKYVVRSGSGQDANHFCPFTGGGDVYITRKVAGACVMGVGVKVGVGEESTEAETSALQGRNYI